ncbi:MAG: DUF1592 domain-containing protein [Myxococcota bacterium]
MAARRISLLALLCACTGSIAEGGGDGPAPVIIDREGVTPEGTLPPVEPEMVREAECDDRDRELTLMPLRRLSNPEMRASLAGLFPAEVIAEMDVWLGGLPSEATLHGPQEFEPTIGESGADATLELTTRLAATVAGNDGHLRAIGAGCALESADRECAEGFIGEFGARVFRRPLTGDELADFTEDFLSDDGIEDDRERMEVVISALLLSPEFLHHVPRRGDGARVALDPLTLAARLSYAVTGGAPDDALIAAAQAGELDDVETRRTHARRLAESDAGRIFVRSLFVRWLGLHGQYSPQPAADLAGMDTDGLVDEVTTEALDFIEHVVYSGGNFEELMTSTLAFPKTDRLVTIFGTERSDDAVSASDRRAGLLTRPALLVYKNDRPSPIRRGLYIWERFFCHVFTLPEGLDADEEANANLEASGLVREESTSRELTEAATGARQCAGCHDQINPPGFSLAHFGPLGEEWIEHEIVYAPEGDGEVLNELPLEGDGNVAGMVVDDVAQTIDGARDMAQIIAGSSDGLACAATQMFRATHLREATSLDACHLQTLINAFDAGEPILDILVRNAAEETPYVMGPQAETRFYAELAGDDR